MRYQTFWGILFMLFVMLFSCDTKDDDIQTTSPTEPESNSDMSPNAAFTYDFPRTLFDTLLFAGEKVTFTNSSEDEDGTIEEWLWDFGNGESSEEENPVVQFHHMGEFAVHLSVKDNMGATDDTTINIVVHGVDLPPWEEGILDIHHINTGRGDATFMVFPDGTNMLYDAGDKYAPGDSEPDFPIHPNNSKTPGEWIAHYIQQVLNDNQPNQIDYALISHFHVDHMGKINDSSPLASNSAYRLGGITAVGDILPIKTISDRGYEAYNFPVDLIDYRDDIANYVNFINYHKNNGGLQPVAFDVGKRNQFGLKYMPGSYPSFYVDNIHANGQIKVSEDSEDTYDFQYYTPVVNNAGEWSGNPLSLVLKVNYGDFDYFTGGDLTGVDSHPDFDLETPVSQVVGEVDAMVLNHHGRPDATNSTFVQNLMPQVAIQLASNENHVNTITFNRLNAVGADLFIGNMGGFYASQGFISQKYKSIEGHILIRVLEGGSEFYVYILSDKSPEMPAIKKFGPYQSR